MSRVLVANRGAIACRIIRTLDRLGVESVAVFADVDAASPHVAMATTAVRLDAASPGAAYRDIDQLVAIATATGATGVHPGYGFLAENAGFAAAVEAAGIAFVGPTPEQIAWFGQKDKARDAAIAAGVPLLPASDALDVVDAAVAAAKDLGLPVIVKSVAGGGGMGMTVCHDPDALVEAVEAAMRQGEQLFGVPAVVVERFVTHARHIEVQVFGDGAGRVLALGERDCSLQRRRQKVLEEAPAPHLDPEVRAALLDASRALLEPMAYRSAGTVEFVVDADDCTPAFLEVNTRLQVEHGVTEEVLGVDLVEWMVRLAHGDASVLPDQAPPVRGHAIQVRLYAEDPTKGSLPSSGTLTHVALPEGVRVDGWVATGTEVSPHFDPMLAKVIVHAETRAAALDRLGAALAATRIDGVETNVEQLAAVVASPEVVEGRVLTTTLEEFAFVSRAVDVVAPGGETTVQDLPGRLGYWEVGVPPSGPFDDRSFALGNRRLGNEPGAPGLECVAGGPTLRFRTPTWVCLTGAHDDARLDGAPVPWATPVAAGAGSVLEVGQADGAGLRTYVLFAGGLDVPRYLGSASTFTLGEFGGHGGRALRAGDVLHLTEAAATPPSAVGDESSEAPPALDAHWEIGVVDGPHAAPEFFTPDDVDMIYGTDWEVHYQSSRTGVRLVGPKPQWARTDGGSAGLHPSNIHDTPYVPGTLDFTGDMPIILGPDGPSLGGFVCPVTIVSDEQWKIGQLAPGNTVRFIRRNPPDDGVLARTEAGEGRPAVTYRRDGDRALLVEFGPMTLDFDLRMRAQALFERVQAEAVPGVVDLVLGIRALQVRVDGEQATLDGMLGLLQEMEAALPATEDLAVASRVVHLPLSWDDPATREAIARYMRVVRDDAPWCPWNIEFIRRINGLADVDEVQRIVFDAEYLVMGLGDVYLGAPVAVPVDPRHRLVTTKYNPARTWTPENAVGIGGAYLCIYGMEGPGGYQFVGRTIPVWSRYGAGRHFSPDRPWLLRHFDRISWYPVEAEELLDLRAEARAGRFDPSIETGSFRLADHKAFVTEHGDSITEFEARRDAAYAEERAAWQASGELTRDHGAHTAVPSHSADELADLPPETVIVTSPLAGAVARVLCAVGDRVGPGESLVTVEAMKMEHHVDAPCPGTVVRVVVSDGEVVHPGTPLIAIDPA